MSTWRNRGGGRGWGGSCCYGRSTRYINSPSHSKGCFSTRKTKRFQTFHKYKQHYYQNIKFPAITICLENHRSIFAGSNNPLMDKCSVIPPNFKGVFQYCYDGRLNNSTTHRSRDLSKLKTVLIRDLQTILGEGNWVKINFSSFKK